MCLSVEESMWLHDSPSMTPIAFIKHTLKINWTSSFKIGVVRVTTITQVVVVCILTKTLLSYQPYGRASQIKEHQNTAKKRTNKWNRTRQRPHKMRGISLLHEQVNKKGELSWSLVQLNVDVLNRLGTMFMVNRRVMQALGNRFGFPALPTIVCKTWCYKWCDIWQVSNNIKRNTYKFRFHTGLTLQ